MAKRRTFGRGYDSGWSRRQTPSAYSHLWTVVRKEALLRDGYVCQLRFEGCLGKATEVDHIVSVADGGTNELENARATCRPCHRKRTARQGAAAAKKARQRRDNDTPKEESR